MKPCELEVGASRMALNFISRPRAPKCRRDRNQMVIGKPSLTQARLHCRQVAARASDLDAVWCKKARPRSALPIVISKGAWATATRLYIWRRQPSWPQARWPDSFARHKVSPTNPQAPPHGALKKNHGQRRRCRSWKVFPPAYAAGFCSSTKTI